MTYDEKIKKLSQIIKDSKRTVFFGGAGVSTESGLKDYRSETGIYNTVKSYGVSPETILSHSFFLDDPKTFYKFYRDFFIGDVKPNMAHISLAKLENTGMLSAIITQNVDNLHQLAGAKNVLELHGTAEKYYCCRCKKKYTKKIFDVNWGEVSQAETDFSAVKQSENSGFVEENVVLAKEKQGETSKYYDGENCFSVCGGVPHCSCGGIIRPLVTLYEEALDEAVTDRAISEIYSADTLIVGGTSLAVYPAAAYLSYFKGKNLIVINKQKTPVDSSANIVFYESIGRVLGDVVSCIEQI
jgi:NAD-dependent deacetylase